MATTQDKVFANGTKSAAGFSTVATVPAGKVWVLKDAIFCMNTVTDTAMGASTRRAGVDIWYINSVPVRFSNSPHFRGRVVMEAGDQLVLWTAAAQPLLYWLSGVEITP